MSGLTMMKMPKTFPILIICGAVICFLILANAPASHAAASNKKPAKKSSKHLSSEEYVAILYVRAMVLEDRLTVGRLDFSCLFRMVAASKKGLKAYPRKKDPVYDECWQSIAQANAEPIFQKNEGLYTLWPGPGKLVFFDEDFKRYHYPASTFVSSRAAARTKGSGVRVTVVNSSPMPIVSFRLRPNEEMVGGSATLVQLRVEYKDPLTSPISYAPGTYQWANPVRRPRQAIKKVVLQWVVLSDLKTLGFPRNWAVLNLPVVPATATRPAAPFSTEHSGYVLDTAEWWGPTDSPSNLVAAVGRASQLPSLRDRVAMLNRVLIIDPDQADALTALTRDLYAAILEDGANAHKVKIEDKALAARFTEFYWDTYAQTTRVDISLDMEMGGFSNPTTADSLFRMIPAMEKLAKIRPEDLENRFRLGIAYRWNLDQLIAIDTHADLVRVLPTERAALRARALRELAWSKITKVAFNRMFDDPAIREAYQEAREAFELATSPLDKFAASYTMAYSLVFTPDRDNRVILDLLTEAKRWYMEVDGASEESWRVLLDNDTLKPVIDADPTLHQLVASADRS